MSKLLNFDALQKLRDRVCEAIDRTGKNADLDVALAELQNTFAVEARSLERQSLYTLELEPYKQAETMVGKWYVAEGTSMLTLMRIGRAIPPTESEPSDKSSMLLEADFCIKQKGSEIYVTRSMRVDTTFWKLREIDPTEAKKIAESVYQNFKNIMNSLQ